MDLKLKDKVALVTGASHGLGKTMCMMLAAEGAKVAVNYRRNPEKAEAVVTEIKQTHGTDAIRALGDVVDEGDVAKIYDRIEQELGPVDILINNAAVCPTGKVKDMSLETWTRTINVNLNGTFLASREFVRRAVDEGRTGRIVNISSQAAFRGSTSGHAPYDSSKGGMVSFTISLARELAPHGICVNAVAPGLMYTDMTKDKIDANREKYNQRIPLQRIGRPEEIAAVVLFLASDQASYMTGATVDVSGGLAMH